MLKRYRATARPAAPPRSVKADDDPTSRTIKGYASAWGIVDSYDEIVLKGAFIETLANEEHARRRKVLWNHKGPGWKEDTRPIGIPSVLEEDDYGLYYETEAAPTPLGDEVLALYRADIITENSIGFDLSWDDVEIMLGPDGDTVIAIKRVNKLWEVSPVIWGANPGAIMVRAKGHCGPEWMPLRNDLDRAIRQVRSALGSGSIVARLLAHDRARFDHLGADHECTNCGGCGKAVAPEHAEAQMALASEAAGNLVQVLRSGMAPQESPIDRLKRLAAS